MIKATLYLTLCAIIITAYIMIIKFFTEDEKNNKIENALSNEKKSINNKEKSIDNCNNRKKVIATIIVISLTVISLVIMPNNSTDIYYYMAVGRTDSKYHENSYKTLFNEIQQKYPQDEIVSSAPHLDVTFTYGALWRLICQILSSFPTNSTIVMLYVYKTVNAILHLANCHLIYKISRKNKLRNALIYGINPLILFEGIINCHNDMYIVFLTLLAFYLKGKDKIGASVASITAGTLIKYVPALFLPYILQKKDWKKKITYMIEFVLIFFLSSFIMLGNLNDIFSFLQQTGFYSNSLYVFTLLIAENKIDLIAFIGKMVFIGIYLYKIIKLEKNKNEEQENAYKNLLIVFLFLVITNFRAWYIMWLFALIPISKDNDIKEIVALSFAGEIANVISFTLGESYIYSMFYFLIFVGIYVLYLIVTIVKKSKEKNNIKLLLNKKT